MALDQDLIALLTGNSPGKTPSWTQTVRSICEHVLRAGVARSGSGVWVDLLAEARSVEELSVVLSAFRGQLSAEAVAEREAALREGLVSLRARLVGALVEVDAGGAAALIAAPDQAIARE